MKLQHLTATSTLAVALVGAIAGPAEAVPTKPASACKAGDTALDAVGDSYHFKTAKGANAVVAGDPGVTLTISKSTTFTVGGSLGATTGISASAVVATVKQDYSITITGSYSAQSAVSGAWTVPKSYKNGGQLSIGARKHSGVVNKWSLSATCDRLALLASANYNAPQRGWYFHHKEL